MLTNTGPARNQRSLRRAIRAAAKLPAAAFLRELMSNPREMGAVWPSSRTLARRIAQAVPWEDKKGKIVELGGGTGVITEALLDRGIPPERLIVIERASILADLLRERFPRVKIIEGDAAQLTTLLEEEEEVAVVVSGLPLRSLPPRVVATIIREVSDLLKPGGLLVQFTYHLLPQHSLSQRFTAVSSRLVWGNIPPARVGMFINRRLSANGQGGSPQCSSPNPDPEF